MRLRLKEARLRSSLKQNELADLIHVSRQAYSLYERGKRRPSWETMIALAKALNVSTDFLLGLSEDPNPSLKLDPREQEIVRTYHRLDERGKGMIDITLQEQSRYIVSAEDGGNQSA